jgi:hypothetical protein
MVNWLCWGATEDYYLPALLTAGHRQLTQGTMKKQAVRIKQDEKEPIMQVLSLLAGVYCTARAL